MSPKCLFLIGLFAAGLAASACAADPAAPMGWTDWRGGPRRDGISSDVPQCLPKQLGTAWTHPLTAGSMGGVAATDRYVIVSDKKGDRDVWRCLAVDFVDQLTALAVERLTRTASGISATSPPGVPSNVSSPLRDSS